MSDPTTPSRVRTRLIQSRLETAVLESLEMDPTGRLLDEGGFEIPFDVLLTLTCSQWSPIQ